MPRYSLPIGLPGLPAETVDYSGSKLRQRDRAQRSLHALLKRGANSQPLTFAGSRTRLNMVRDARLGLESENNYSDILVFASPGVCKTGGEYEEVDGATLPLASRSDGGCANQFAGAHGHG